MTTVDEALALIVAHAGRQPIAPVALAEAAGLVLAEVIDGDRDSPPFAKAMMDGFAVRSEDVAGPTCEFTVLGELPAGQLADRPVTAGATFQIMTGAAMPEGADAVIPVEQCERLSAETVRLKAPDFQAGQHVMGRGRIMKAGDRLLQPGHLLGAPELGLLASIGVVEPKVYSRPTLAVLATGDELVAPESEPGPGQIRNSNALTLLALAEGAGARATGLGIARDEPAELSAKVARGLATDVLVLCGGVSAGTRDLVPGILNQHHVREILHQVALKPGKPIWFGTHSGGLVFGLPGNPVSALVCFALFVRTALRARMGHADPLPKPIRAALTADFPFRTGRLTYHPARLSIGEGVYQVAMVPWLGSPDLRGVCAANALAIVPIGDNLFRAGDVIDVLPFERD